MLQLLSTEVDPTMPILRSGKDTNQSAGSLSEDLLECCRSETLSEEVLREVFECHGLTPNDNRRGVGDYGFFHVACLNEGVTEGMIQCLLDYFPTAVNVTDVHGCLPLHNACFNKNVTPSIFAI